METQDEEVHSQKFGVDKCVEFTFEDLEIDQILQCACVNVTMNLTVAHNYNAPIFFFFKEKGLHPDRHSQSLYLILKALFSVWGRDRSHLC